MKNQGRLKSHWKNPWVSSRFKQKIMSITTNLFGVLKKVLILSTMQVRKKLTQTTLRMISLTSQAQTNQCKILVQSIALQEVILLIGSHTTRSFKEKWTALLIKSQKSNASTISLQTQMSHQYWSMIAL